MKIQKSTLIEELKQIVRDEINLAKSLKSSPATALEWKSDPESWNILEVLEHLNRYSEFYLPEFKRQLGKRKVSQQKYFRSGWMGNKAALSMKPELSGKVSNPMKTFKSKDPIRNPGKVNAGVIDEFIADQEEVLEVLAKSEYADLNTKGRTTLPLIKFKLGDLLRFYVYHQERHFTQIERLKRQSGNEI